MPETPPNDDPFAELFSRLPTAPARDAAASHTATPGAAATPAAPAAAGSAPDASTPATAADAAAPAPLSRRAARQAAQAGAEGSAGTTSPADASRAEDASAAHGAPVSAAAAVGSAAAASPAPAGAVSAGAAPAGRTAPAPEKAVDAAAPASGAARTPQTLDALFDSSHDDDAHARAARHHRDRRKGRIVGWVIFGVVLALLGGIVGGGFAVWNTYESQIRSFMGWEEPKDYDAGLAEGQAQVTIVSGDTGSSISQTLYDAGVTKTPDAFYDYLISAGKNPTFQPGVYNLQQKMASAAALEALLDPANKADNSVLITEGMGMKGAVSAISAGTGLAEDEITAAMADYTQYGVPAEAPSIEGYLFPATYTFDPGVSAHDVIQRMVDETFSRLDALGVAPADRFHILTLAGLVQKESGPSEEDMRKIARVFLNRVAADMPMQSDATVAYGAGITGTVWTTDEERADASNPYNTYVHLGLPPGPISNPGEAAIKAAISPADGTWLYFVAVNLETGETIFSDTYEEHEVAVKQMQDWCAVPANASYCE
ncbi:endolytic transglycosylase MltG [Microbacterium paulum]